MRSHSLIGIGLGLVAAVVFASATTGPLFARFLLLFITPLAIYLSATQKFQTKHRDWDGNGVKTP